MISAMLWVMKIWVMMRHLQRCVLTFCVLFFKGHHVRSNHNMKMIWFDLLCDFDMSRDNNYIKRHRPWPWPEIRSSMMMPSRTVGSQMRQIASLGLKSLQNRTCSHSTYQTAIASNTASYVTWAPSVSHHWLIHHWKLHGWTCFLGAMVLE